MGAVFALILRTQVTRGRVLVLSVLAAVLLALALVISRAVGPAQRPEAAYALVDGYGLALLVPLTALVFASAALGEPAEDGTLLYLWHRPIARWRLAAAALAAAVCIALPLAVGATSLAAAVAGGGGALVAGAAAGSVLGVVTYSALFLGLGLLVQRALAWGLAYVLIWEGFVARSGVGPARLSVLLYARSMLADVAGHAPPRLAASTRVSVLTAVAVAVVAVAATTGLLRRTDVR